MLQARARVISEVWWFSHVHSAHCLLSVWIFCCLYPKIKRKFFLPQRWSCGWLPYCISLLFYFPSGTGPCSKYKDKSSFRNYSWLQSPGHWGNQNAGLQKHSQPSIPCWWRGQRERDSVYSSLPGADSQLLGTEKLLVTLPCLIFREVSLECPEWPNPQGTMVTVSNC